MKNIVKINNLSLQYKKISSTLNLSLKKILNNADFINGAEVKNLEEMLKKRLNVKNVATCGNGTDAIQIALMSLNLKPGSEVIMPSFSYISTIETVAMLGLKPVLIDVKQETFNIDESKIKKYITNKTKVIMPVHLYGQNSNMEKIIKIAKKNKLFVIEDAAQSIDSEVKFLNGKIYKSGTIGDIGCFSFFPTKNFGCYGDGGALITNNNNLAKKINMIKNHGQISKYNHEIIGVNSRLDTIQASVLKIKLKNLKKENKQRNQNAKFYDYHLSKLTDIILPKKFNFTNHTYHQYTIRVLRGKRNLLKSYLESKNVQTIIYYPKPLHSQNGYKKLIHNKDDLKISEKLSKEVLSIPIHAYLTKKDLKYVVKEIKSFYA